MSLSSARFVVANPKGVHGRVATRLAELVCSLGECGVELEKDGEVADCRSILDVLSLALVCGSEVTVRASGARRDEAVRQVGALLMKKGDPGA
jgi:phosphocarrier protein HPr